MGNYIRLSLETHLFFARIMKEHALFLTAGFQCKEKAWIRRADMFYKQFESLHRDVVMVSDKRVGKEILDSCELITEHTIPAERRTQQLSGVQIDSRITMRQQALSAGGDNCEDRNMMPVVTRINQRALQLLDGLISFKENLLQEMSEARVYNANYPLLIKHIIREAKLYRQLVCELIDNQDISKKDLQETENFWNQIMMEHALFIRGLLDPSEVELIDNADCYAVEYRELLEAAREQDCKAGKMREESLGTTLRFSGFKEAGTEGILECKIASIIMPLLADHVLREANHYIRLLQSAENEEECMMETSCSCEDHCKNHCDNHCEKPKENACNCRR
ncbi:MAG: DUF2935 domain-containing protein [Lachnospiraceae bacterium]|nr:DUF2935 domain-containing protein [Lachnospiraceae bacterium]